MTIIYVISFCRVPTCWFPKKVAMRTRDNLRYAADDAVLLARNQESLQELIATVVHHSQQMGQKLKKRK